MSPDVWTTVASTLRARHYAKIAKALRARQYNARSVRGRRGIRCIRVAIPDTDWWAWVGTAAAWWSDTTMSQMWGGVVCQGPGQIVQVGELLTTISSTETDVEKIAESIARAIDEVEIAFCSLPQAYSEWSLLPY